MEQETVLVPEELVGVRLDKVLSELFSDLSRSNIKQLINYKKVLINEKVEKAIDWVEEKGFKLLFLAYACPFLPACVVTISQGIAKRDFADFIPAVVAGKLVMFFIVSYIGKDIFGFITNPFKVCVLLIITFIAWKMGNKLNKDLDEYEKKRINEE